MLSYVSLFSSAGVGCYGVKQLGYACVATVELNERRMEIQKHNNKCINEDGYICGDISNESIQSSLFKIIDRFKNNNNAKDLDLLIATPPCQGMSVANHKKKNELTRNSLIVESLKITSKVKPRFFIFENVSSFLKSICTDMDGKNKSIYEAIECNLSGEYLISYDVINFKNYGSNSSRTRTLVLGVRKDIKEITPLDIFPEYKKEKPLKSVIGKMKPLKEMGEIDSNDIYHNFRPYKEHMRSWIKDIKEGESAFDNIEDTKKPHQIKDGILVINQNKNGDKYKRQHWNKVAPCIHTRNDILASQNTVHPIDDRVFSIRELMKMMTIPDSFQWSSMDLKTLNAMNEEEKRKFLKKNEMNIRQCIGEAVPTAIFTQISSKIKNVLNKRKVLSKKDISEIIEKNKLFSGHNLEKFIEKNIDLYSLNNLFIIAEFANSERNNTSAFYTRQDICYSLIKDLPSLKKNDDLTILEPSVGAGNFIPLLIKKYQEKKSITIDVVDINSSSIAIFKMLMRKMDLPKNVKINFINDDFLLHDFDNKYDIVIGNPPYGKVKDKKLLMLYKNNVINTKTNNVFSFFIEKCINLSSYCALIVPKSLINSPGYKITKSIIEKNKILKINDYNEKAFDVKIETIGFLLENKKMPKNNIVKIESFLLKKTFFQEQQYMISKEFDSWLLYRNDFFDTVCKKLEFDVFETYRDRQITKKHLVEDGKIRVLKSKNISSNKIIDIDGYDRFIDNIEIFSVSKYINKKDVVLVPNLTYNPRATFLPKNCIVDGSVAVLTPKKEYSQKILEQDLDYYASDEFRTFYKIARNYGTRSLNIDNNSAKFFGIRKK
jgi:DNA (cytosine-5)-methyltransferase 1